MSLAGQTIGHIPSSGAGQTVGSGSTIDHGPPATATLPTLFSGLSAVARASLRAAWWTRQLLDSFQAPPFDTTHLYDQSGRGKTITSGASIGTAAEGMDTTLVFDPTVPNTFTRSDALGLAADPALTIVWKMKCTANLGTSPTLLSLGTAGDSELSLYFDGVGVWATNFENDRTVGWAADTTTWATWALTKPAGSGYTNTWRIYQGTTALGAPGTVTTGALALGNTSLILGNFDGGGFPFGGHLAGMLVFERELSGADLTLVSAL